MTRLPATPTHVPVTLRMQASATVRTRMARLRTRGQPGLSSAGNGARVQLAPLLAVEMVARSLAQFRPALLESLEQ
jgi:hypothetical protein